MGGGEGGSVFGKFVAAFDRSSCHDCSQTLLWLIL